MLMSYGVSFRDACAAAKAVVSSFGGHRDAYWASDARKVVPLMAQIADEDVRIERACAPFQIKEDVFQCYDGRWETIWSVVGLKNGTPLKSVTYRDGNIEVSTAGKYCKVRGANGGLRIEDFEFFGNIHMVPNSLTIVPADDVPSDEVELVHYVEDETWGTFVDVFRFKVVL